jgi:hypothetical protein
MLRFQLHKIEVALDRSAGLQAAVTAALQASPAVLKLTAICQNLQQQWSNERNARAGCALTPLLKTIAGHPVGVVPVDAGLRALGALVPVGTALPALGFPLAGAWTHAAVMSLSHVQLNDLEWFYNQLFGGATITNREESFWRFLGGQ